MIQKHILISLIFILVITNLFSQSMRGFKWPNGARAAVCLTYDDGLSSHVNTVAPALKVYGFKGTFYPTLASTSIRKEMSKWQALAEAGHELGNHTVYHPCQKSTKGMEWVKDYHDLDNYTLDQIKEEIQLANTMLLAIDGKKERTFAYPCAHYLAGGKSYKPYIMLEFLSGRGSSENRDTIPKISDIDLYNVTSWAPNGHDSSELISYIEKIIENKTLSTLTFHGVGAEHMKVSAKAHEELLQYLSAHRDKIWVTTFQEATEYLSKYKHATSQ